MSNRTYVALWLGYFADAEATLMFDRLAKAPKKIDRDTREKETMPKNGRRLPSSLPPPLFAACDRAISGPRVSQRLERGTMNVNALWTLLKRATEPHCTINAFPGVYFVV